MKLPLPLLLVSTLAAQTTTDVDVATGKPLFARSADKLFGPASTTKLFSCAAALEALGAERRFETPVYAVGNAGADGTLDGDLVLVASGDLTLGGRTTKTDKVAWRNLDHIYANWRGYGELTPQDPLAGLDALARQVAAAGIEHVKGAVMVDDRLFDSARSTGSGPTHVAPIYVNDNLIDITIEPTEAGKAARLVSRPKTSAVTVTNRVETVAAGGTASIRLSRGRRPADCVVTGTVPAGHKKSMRIWEPGRPAWFARHLFVDALGRAGVRVDRSQRSRLPTDYRGAKRVATFASPPFGENLTLILKVSHNLHASTLPLLIAASRGKRRLADGLRLQSDLLRRIGVPVDTISFGGAAGGARADLTTPRATVALLVAMAKRDDFAFFRSALPVLGVDGTLADNIPKSPAKGHVYGKTGTYVVANTMNGTLLLTSKALAGYIDARSGRLLAYSVVVNNVHLDDEVTKKRIGDDVARVCEAWWRAL